MKALAFGEILWDIIDGNRYLGGAPLNFAAHLTKFGHSVSIVSRVGDDSMGSEAIKQITALGVSTELIQTDTQYPTGAVNVQLSQGQPDYTIQNDVAYDFIEFQKFIRHVKEMAYDVTYIGTLAQRKNTSHKTLMAILKAVSCKHVFYDVNLRKNGFSLKTIVQSLYHSTILKLNMEEVDVISRLIFQTEYSTLTEFCQTLTQTYASQIIIVTDAANGCYVFYNKNLSHVAGYPVGVVDAVGAGDAFSATFVHTYFATGDVLISARQANRVGAFVASQPGAIPVYSSELNKFLGIQ